MCTSPSKGVTCSPWSAVACVPAAEHLEALQEFTGSVGAPLPLLTFRLEAVPEMGYDPLADPPRGEIIIKGPVVFQGYYQVRACRACERLVCVVHSTPLLYDCQYEVQR